MAPLPPLSEGMNPSLLALFVAAAVTAACQPSAGTSSATPSPISSTSSAYRRVRFSLSAGLEERVDLFPAQWRVGDIVRVGAKFFNRSQDSVLVNLVPCQGTLRDAGPLRLTMTARAVCPTAWESLWLAPGDSAAHRTERFVVRGPPGEHFLLIQAAKKADPPVRVPVTVLPTAPPD